MRFRVSELNPPELGRFGQRHMCVREGEAEDFFAARSVALICRLIYASTGIEHVLITRRVCIDDG